MIVEEPSAADAIEILKGLRPHYEKFHSVKISDEAISAAVPTPGGVGGLEAAVAWFYQQYQRSSVPESTTEQLATAFSNGVLTALGYRLTMYIWGAVGVVYYLSSRKEIRQAVQVVEIEPAELAQAH